MKSLRYKIWVKPELAISAACVDTYFNLNQWNYMITFLSGANPFNLSCFKENKLK